MNISLDCSHLVVVVELDTQEQQYYLVPRGRHAPVAVPPQTVRRLQQALGLDLQLPAGPTHVGAPESPSASVPEQEPVLETGIELLVPGTLEGPADPFGVAEG